jgi:hypothetical protein
MAFRPDHDLHKRRMSRNLGLGLVLLLFVALVYGLTVVKTSQRGVEALPHTQGDG